MSVFATAGLNLPYQVTLGPEGDLYVCNGGASNIVVLYQFTGQVARHFGDGVVRPRDAAFGADGALYVADYIAGALRFDPATGSFLGAFCSPTNFATPTGAYGLCFGPDGNLYVSDSGNKRVLRFNGTNGVLLNQFASGGGLDNPVGLRFGGDGHLYVVSNNWYGTGRQCVIRYNGTTGAFMDQFATGGITTSWGISFLAFTPPPPPCTPLPAGAVAW